MSVPVLQSWFHHITSDVSSIYKYIHIQSKPIQILGLTKVTPTDPGIHTHSHTHIETQDTRVTKSRSNIYSCILPAKVEKERENKREKEREGGRERSQAQLRVPGRCELKIKFLQVICFLIKVLYAGQRRAKFGEVSEMSHTLPWRRKR